MSLTNLVVYHKLYLVIGKALFVHIYERQIARYKNNSHVVFHPPPSSRSLAAFFLILLSILTSCINVISCRLGQRMISLSLEALWVPLMLQTSWGVIQLLSFVSRFKNFLWEELWLWFARQWKWHIVTTQIQALSEKRVRKITLYFCYFSFELRIGAYNEKKK